MIYLIIVILNVVDSKNLDEVFTFNHIALIHSMPLLFKASIILMRADHYFIHYYIR